jgi:predicted nucleic acid-binding protein
MTLFPLVYLDTNILIALLEDEFEKGDALRKTIAGHRRSDAAPRFLTSALTFSELLVKPYRDHAHAAAQFYVALRAGNYWLSVVPVSEQVLDLAAALRAARRSLKLPDAIHVATAMQSGCSHLLTEDEGIQTGEPALHPLTGAGLTPVPVIRPDAPTLSAILKDLTP